ncbi:MAG: WD40/YVTN/BNR-like repeat-containing protein [Bryobacteraceae bacterium]
MRLVVLALASISGAWADPSGHDLFACSHASKGWAAGMKLQSSGLFFRWAEGAWTLSGGKRPNLETLDFDPRDSRVLYLAGGNGCLRSRDSGRTWVITTDERFTELRDLSVDRNAPDHIYIALPDGAAVTRDQGRTWQALDIGVARRYTKTIRVDRTRAGRVLAGTEQAILLSEDAGARWRAVASGEMFTHLEQSPQDPRRWLATAQRGGALASEDGGQTWRQVAGVPRDRTLYNAAFDPTDPARIAVSGWDAGVLVSGDLGRTWEARNTGLPSNWVWRVAFDPDHSGRLFASVHEEAVFVSDDAGRKWRREGLDGSIVYDLVFVPRPQPPPSREAAFRERVRSVIEYYANPPDPAATGYQHISAKLYFGRETEWASRRLIELLREPSGDMFWMFPVTAIAYRGRDKLTPEAQSALRHAWKTYAPYRGDTENHWLLYYSCLYLMAQLWPDQPADAWYTGKSSAENFKESERWILHWMDLTRSKGQGEYDATHYLGVYLLPLSYLAEWATDPAMRQRARMMLEWVMVDYAADNLNGLYVGAHARTDDRNVLEKWYGVGSDFGWLLFGLGRPLPGYSYGAYHFAVASAYLPPEVIHRIATDRTRDYVHRELKRTRNRWRYEDARNAEVYKTTYMRREYAVGSDQGGLWQPAQHHSWDVTWAVPDPRGVHNTLFSMHPYSSARGLQTYYTPMPDFIVEAISRFRPSYDQPDKLLGGSPYEQVFQDQDTVIALYNIPPGTRWPHINGFFSKDLARLEEHPSGWIFCQGGEAYMAYRPLAPYEWRAIDYHNLLPVNEGGKRLSSPHLKNGTVVQTASSGEFPDFGAFRKAILALPFSSTLDPVPSVKMRTLRGKDLAFTYGQPRDWSAWKMFDSPYVESARGSHVLVLRHGSLRRVLDFNRLTIE